MGVIFNKMVGAAGSVASLLGSTPKRTVLGMGIGAAYGGITAEESGVAGSTLASMAKGAIGGAAVGASTMALSKRFWGLQKGGKISQSMGMGILRPGIKAGEIGIGMGLRGATFAFNRPKTAMALGAGAYGLYSAVKPSDISVEEMGMIAQETGVSSTGFAPGMGAARAQQSRAMFMNSTDGLVFGLHQGRHR